MARTEGEKISRQKYESKAYDQILLKVRKGKRDEYKQAAEKLGLGQMEMIRLATETFIAAHNGGDFRATLENELGISELTDEEKQLLDAFKQLPAPAQEHFLQAFKETSERITHQTKAFKSLLKRIKEE